MWDWPTTICCDKHCTTTSLGRPRQRCPATTSPLMMCLAASASHTGRGTDWRCKGSCLACTEATSRSISTLEQANAFLRQHYMAEFNRLFAKPAAEKGTRVPQPTRKDLDYLFSIETWD